MLKYFGPRMGRFAASVFLILFAVFTAFASDDDVVVMKNGDRLTGEIKSLQRGTLKFKPDYMTDSANIDWARVERIESKSTFMISMVDGQLFTNVIRLLPSNSPEMPNFVIGPGYQSVRVLQRDVIRILPVEAGFWKRLEGSIDFGFNFTSGNDQYQTELVATTTYRQGDHSYTASLDTSFSGQPDGDSTKRREFNFDYRKQLSPRWYAGGLLNFLSSDQQSLDLRTSVGGLLGRNLKQTENTRFSVFGGVAGTREHYSASVGTPRTTNADAIAGFDFSTFRFKTTDVVTRFSLYPSLSTPGRTRLQVTSDLRIKVVKDLYWGFHFYENFDSKPPVRADKNDLSISTSLGWKF